ncbi:Protein TOS1 [Cyphellophora attinorum]|uniref:glucan endo-1,3-beta-D-glucosidase n=1 Tax=Cyphellophora attinorum TaxID=1664694 RepID=A0A0N1HGA6_9EURO|nr:Protein TOS1 [Phialophora attinorum]KPI45163.1 Protein TOS1 [Phialophora attinorum]
MKANTGHLALVAAALTPAIASTANSQGCIEENGNWYCQQTNAITYSNFGQAGAYSKITAMDSESGTCSSQRQTYKGGLAPLDDEVSWHFRGPLRLKQFGFYTLGQAGPVRPRSDGHHMSGPVSHRRRHTHHFLHQLPEETRVEPEADAVAVAGVENADQIPSEMLEERGVGDWVTVTMDGKVVSWINQYSGPAVAAATSAPSATETQPNSPPSAGDEHRGADPDSFHKPEPSDDKPEAQAQPSIVTSTISLDPPPSPAEPSPAEEPEANSDGGTWLRQSYYNSDSPDTTENIAFLGNHGDPSCSGTFGYKFGLSQSYLASDGQQCSPNAQPLSDVLLPDNTEISLFTNAPCTTDDPCPYSRPGNIAHHGFGGASKLFLFELSMPLSGQRGGLNSDMPAAWILNAEIPRTLQYGNAECSCWESGCGEFDIMEVLDPGNAKMKSTWHGQGAVGDSDWFERPTGDSRKAAVVMDGQQGSVSVLWLDDRVDFGGSMGVDDVEGWLSGIGSDSSGVRKVVKLGSV